LKVLSQLGLIMFMFIVGLELDTTLIRGKERIAAIVSLSSVALPFTLGVLLATALHPSHDGTKNAGDFLPFALFIGASMSVTAFPVLARILTERGMHRTELGALALACAAVDDILAWSLLALVLAIVASAGISDLPLILGESVAFVAFMFIVVKPQLEVLATRYRKAGRLTPNILAVILVGFLACSYITDKIGIHSIFGAFIFGVVMPRKDTSEFFHEILQQLEQAAVLLLLPVFFIVTGLEVNVRGLGGDAFTQLPLIILVACAGKFIGATVAARSQKVPMRKSAAIGVLMNTRGLTELVILNVGKEAGVLDDRLFTMLVVMAVVTTVMTEPLMRLVYPDRMIKRDVAEAERAALGLVDAYRVVVLVEETAAAAHLVDLAGAIVGDEDPAEIVLTRFRPQPKSSSEVGSGLVSELAEVASSLDEMKALARRAEERGIKCLVRSQFSNDVATDIVTQLAAVEADVVIMADTDQEDAAHRHLMSAVLAGAPGAVVIVADPDRLGVGGGPAHPVVVAWGAGTHGGAAAELGLRIARSEHLALRLVAVDPSRRSGRQVSEWGERFNRSGVECRVEPPAATTDELVSRAAGAAMVIMGAGGSPTASAATALARATGAPVVVAHSPEGDDGRTLTKLVERAQARPPAPADSAPVLPGSGGAEALE